VHRPLEVRREVLSGAKYDSWRELAAASTPPSVTANSMNTPNAIVILAIDRTPQPYDVFPRQAQVRQTGTPSTVI